jgi:hypothetical protein
VAWKKVLQANGSLRFEVTGAAVSPQGDTFVPALWISSSQAVSIHRYSAAGADLADAGGYAGGSGIQSPLFVGATARGDLLYGYVTSSTGGHGDAAAIDAPVNGASSKGIFASWSVFSGCELFPGTMSGDLAGRLRLTASVVCKSGEPGLDFGNGPEQGNLVLRYDGAGQYLGSAAPFGGARMDATGASFDVEALTATVDRGCGPVTPASQPAMLVTKYDFGGQCLWSRAYAAPAPQSWRIGLDQSLVMSFLYTGGMNLGAGPLPDGGATNFTVARLDANGDLLASRTFGGAPLAGAQVGTTDAGDFLLAAPYSGPVDLGAGPITGTGTQLLAAFDAAGQLRWSKVVDVTFTSSGYGETQTFQTLPHPCGMVVVTNSPTVDLGAGQLVPPNLYGTLANAAVALIGL